MSIVAYSYLAALHCPSGYNEEIEVEVGHPVPTHSAYL